MCQDEYTKQRIAVFWSYVAVGEPDECWLWQRGDGPKGYGQFWWKGKTCIASRVAYEISYGDPGNALVCHTCDTPGCCNPGHLFTGTSKINQLDKVTKGRQLKHERHNLAKLTIEQVKEIRQIGRKETQKVLALRFGVDRTTISLILLERIWVGV